eukprot:SAG31_NODE_14061_length_829_cov_1.523288_1_plen_75_part_01
MEDVVAPMVCGERLGQQGPIAPKWCRGCELRWESDALAQAGTPSRSIAGAATTNCCTFSAAVILRDMEATGPSAC